MQTFHLYIILMMLFISARASASAEQRTEMKYISLCVNDTSDSFSRPCIGNSSCAETDSAVSVSDKPSFFSKIYGIARNVGRFFNQVDSNYVKPSPKGLTVLLSPNSLQYVRIAALPWSGTRVRRSSSARTGTAVRPRSWDGWCIS